MKNLALIGLLILLTSCSIEPQAINYGTDACQYCKMTIVDQQHAAEIVSKKGRAFKYDAIECMLRDKANDHNSDVALFLVMDYQNPDSFIDATNAMYVISERIPSPMGAFLSAVPNQSDAIDLVDDNGGEWFDWETINTKFQ